MSVHDPEASRWRSRGAVRAREQRLSTGDLDGDDDIDLILTDSSANTVEVLINSGDATFPTSTLFRVGVTPCSTAVGDLNADGALDLAVASNVSDTVSVLLNRCQVACDGDANSDGTVDPLDSGFVLSRLGCEVDGGDPGCDIADQNGDGLVDPLDVGFVLARFGECP